MEYQKVDKWQKRPELNKLLELSDSPDELYYIGRWDKRIFKNCVAVVGSRRMTDYGRRVIEKLIPRLIFEGKTVLSGFMYGVDQYAHRVCVDSGGKTIAVLGWGIDMPLVGYDLKLATKIVESGGLILSEWEKQKPTLWTFPRRNRIVAALANEIIIVEAAVKSGALITARLATKLKRTIWAVPGPITSPTSVGTNMLIATHKAKSWLGDYAQQMPLVGSDPLLKLLTAEALTPDEIARRINRPVAQVGAQLSLLALKGQLTEREGKYYLNNAS